jgi:aminopeptidase-like protein
MMNLIAYCDGARSLLDIAEKINVPIWRIAPIAAKLKGEGLLVAG